MAPTQSSAAQDPLDGLVVRSRRERGWRATSVGSAAVTHALVALAVGTLASRTPPKVRREQVTEIIDIDLPKPSASVPEPPPPVAPPERAAARETAPVPAARAQAAAVLTKAADPNEPVDLSDGFVTGSSSSYAGGTTSSNGASTSAVHGSAAATGDPRATGPAMPMPVGPDRSRKAVLSGGQQWSCTFPAEADREQINEAVVGIRVVVDGLGKPKTVTILRDPGHGFAREAERCAMGKRWSPALDHEGSPQEGTVSVNVRFER